MNTTSTVTAINEYPKQPQQRKRGRLAVSTSVGSVCTLVWGGGYAVPGV